MIETGKPLQHGPLQDHAEDADDDGRDDQRGPVSDTHHVEQEIGDESAHHVERAMGEIDDVEHAEDHGEPEAEQRVKRAVDQSYKKLCVESLHRSIFRTQVLFLARKTTPPAKRRRGTAAISSTSRTCSPTAA